MFKTDSSRRLFQLKMEKNEAYHYQLEETNSPYAPALSPSASRRYDE
jgi:hypothetical protein